MLVQLYIYIRVFLKRHFAKKTNRPQHYVPLQAAYKPDPKAFFLGQVQGVPALGEKRRAFTLQIFTQHSAGQAENRLSENLQCKSHSTQSKNQFPWVPFSGTWVPFRNLGPYSGYWVSIQELGPLFRDLGSYSGTWAPIQGLGPLFRINKGVYCLYTDQHILFFFCSFPINSFAENCPWCIKEAQSNRNQGPARGPNINVF